LSASSANLTENKYWSTAMRDSQASARTAPRALFFADQFVKLICITIGYRETAFGRSFCMFGA
jgi:hypothetical protein